MLLGMGFGFSKILLIGTINKKYANQYAVPICPSVTYIPVAGIAPIYISKKKFNTKGERIEKAKNYVLLILLQSLKQ